MKRRMAPMGAMLAGCAVVAGLGGPPAGAQDPNTVPPVPLSPSSGQSFAGSSAVTFQVRGIANDSLQIYVSDRPERTSFSGPNPCEGSLIRSNIAQEYLTPTTVPGVYTARVDAEAFTEDPHFMTRANTYYWQAFRTFGSNSLGRPTGCAAGPIRSIVHAQYPPLVPPVPLYPATGARFAANRSVTFRVRSYAGDDSLWLHVSNSSRRNACGTIPDDFFEEFKPTADPRIYAARMPASEAPGNGRLYWQAHRIEAQSDDDFCVEGPIRTIVHGSAPALPRRLPGLYRGRTTQGRAVAFRLASSRTEISYLTASIRLGCSGGILIARFGGQDIAVGSAGSFRQTRFSSGLLNSATVTGKFRSTTRVTGTVAARAPFAGSVGRCGFRRVSWTARRVGR